MSQLLGAGRCVAALRALAPAVSTAQQAAPAPKPDYSAPAGAPYRSGVARPARSALDMQMKNLISHNAKLTDAGKDSAMTQIPPRVDSMMAADPWMKFFLTHDPLSASSPK